MHPGAKRPRRRLAWLAGRAGTVAARLLMKRSNRFLAALFKQLDRLQKRLSAGDGPQPMAELASLFRDDPRGAGAIRRMVIDGQTHLLQALLRGMTLHHSGRSGGGLPVFNRWARGVPCTVAVSGHSGAIGDVAAAYERQANCTVYRIGSPRDAGPQIQALEYRGGVEELDILA
ncbi:hypothetical protein JW905_14420, partial [bacterium]|nr:hypothetical protein [candidate division CSSED10-310 bacterium]